jgi:polysaccharide biosynthesis transport protein
MLTSATAGDGKTSTAANLAVAAARVGLRTLLVDADLRRASVGRRFGLGRTTGLSDLLLNGDSCTSTSWTSGSTTSGSCPPGPSRRTRTSCWPHRRCGPSSTRSSNRSTSSSTTAPAVLAVPDALELGRHVDLAIVVARADTTGRRQLASAIERLEQVGTDVAGTVLNDIDGKQRRLLLQLLLRPSGAGPAALHPSVGSTVG